MGMKLTNTFFEQPAHTGPKSCINVSILECLTLTHVNSNQNHVWQHRLLNSPLIKECDEGLREDGDNLVVQNGIFFRLTFTLAVAIILPDHGGTTLVKIGDQLKVFLLRVSREIYVNFSQTFRVELDLFESDPRFIFARTYEQPGNRFDATHQ
jgi:hypothetical protein